MHEESTPRQSRVRPQYRYECPDCGSVQIYRIRDARTSVGYSEELTAGGWGVKERREKMKRNYKCGYCGAYHVRVHDKKTDNKKRP